MRSKNGREIKERRPRRESKIDVWDNG